MNLEIPLMTRLWAENCRLLGRHQLINGCIFPKEGRSWYEKKCTCGRDKIIDREFSDDDCYQYTCVVCDS